MDNPVHGPVGSGGGPVDDLWGEGRPGRGGEVKALHHRTSQVSLSTWLCCAVPAAPAHYPPPCPPAGPRTRARRPVGPTRPAPYARCPRPAPRPAPPPGPGTARRRRPGWWCVGSAGRSRRPVGGVRGRYRRAWPGSPPAPGCPPSCSPRSSRSRSAPGPRWTTSNAPTRWLTGCWRGAGTASPPAAPRTCPPPRPACPPVRLTRRNRHGEHGWPVRAVPVHPAPRLPGQAEVPAWPGWGASGRG